MNKEFGVAYVLSRRLWWQMSTIWADTVDQARSAARDFVYAGLSDREDLYGLFDCTYSYESVKVYTPS